MAADVFEERLDTIFGNLFQVSCIADNIMVIGYKEDQSDYDKVFTPPVLLFRENALGNFGYNISFIV